MLTQVAARQSRIKARLFEQEGGYPAGHGSEASWVETLLTRKAGRLRLSRSNLAAFRGAKQDVVE